MGAEPPTMALLGYTPKGRKNACMLPPRPMWKPVLRAKISESVPYRIKRMASSFTLSVGPIFSTARRVWPPRKLSMIFISSSSLSFWMEDRALARISLWLLWEPNW